MPGTETVETVDQFLTLKTRLRSLEFGLQHVDQGVDAAHARTKQLILIIRAALKLTYNILGESFFEPGAPGIDEPDDDEPIGRDPASPAEPSPITAAQLEAAQAMARKWSSKVASVAGNGTGDRLGEALREIDARIRQHSAAEVIKTAKARIRAAKTGKAKGKRPAVVAHAGKAKGGKARAAKLSPGRRKAIAKKAARARWHGRTA